MTKNRIAFEHIKCISQHINYMENFLEFWRHNTKHRYAHNIDTLSKYIAHNEDNFILFFFKEKMMFSA